jgi:hypothetical protein
VTVDGVAVHSTPFGPVSLVGSFVVDADDVMIAGFDITGYTATDNAGIYIDGGEGHPHRGQRGSSAATDPAGATLNGLSIAPGRGGVVDIVDNVFENHNIGSTPTPGT